MTLNRAIFYQGKCYKNLLDLYNQNKTDESPTYSYFVLKYRKLNSITKALRYDSKQLRGKFYKSLYFEYQNDSSVSKSLFVKRMRNGMKAKHAIMRRPDIKRMRINNEI